MAPREGPPSRALLGTLRWGWQGVPFVVVQRGAAQTAFLAWGWQGRPLVALTEEVLAQVVAGAIGPDEGLGAAGLSIGVTTTGAASSEEIGGPAVSARVEPGAVASGEAFGSAQLALASATLVLADIASGEATGFPAVEAAVEQAGVPSALALGAVQVSVEVQSLAAGSSWSAGKASLDCEVQVAAIGGELAFGLPQVSPSALDIRVQGLASTALLGHPTVAPPSVPRHGTARRRWRGPTGFLPEPPATNNPIELRLRGVAGDEGIGRPTLAPSRLLSQARRLRDEAELLLVI